LEVTLSTVHGAKGREFDFVFVAGLDEDVFPHVKSKSKSSASDMSEEEAEEARLFYVAVTRARERVVLTHTARRMGGGGVYGDVEPSRFLRSLPKADVEGTSFVLFEKKGGGSLDQGWSGLGQLRGGGGDFCSAKAMLGVRQRPLQRGFKRPRTDEKIESVKPPGVDAVKQPTGDEYD
jgi:DNA helicase II / ATP-dependent DNA helicase PcrA